MILIQHTGRQNRTNDCCLERSFIDSGRAYLELGLKLMPRTRYITVCLIMFDFLITQDLLHACTCAALEAPINIGKSI